MSRIGKKEISIPANTTVVFANGALAVKGPLGELTRQVRPEIAVETKDGKVILKPTVTTLESAALWGTYASHVMNMIAGVNKVFEKKLVLEGIGFKVEVRGDKLVLALGFSHPVNVPIPLGLKVVVEKNVITISGIDKDKVGEFTAHLRALKKPEPYKGKGIRYEGEVIKIKQGKKSV
jgi:large subunit ribosomal protein L6